MEDDELDEALKILRSITGNLSVEELAQVKNILDSLNTTRAGRDHEGTQSFPIEDYKRRN